MTLKKGNGTYVLEKERLQVDFLNLMKENQNKDIIEVRSFWENYSE